MFSLPVWDARALGNVYAEINNKKQSLFACLLYPLARILVDLVSDVPVSN
jgi:hypothetical protein